LILHMSFLFSPYLHPRALHSFPTRRSSDLSWSGPESTRKSCHWLSLPSSPFSDTLSEVSPPIAMRRFIDTTSSSVTPRSVAILVDRKSTRLNSSHLGISYAVFCLKKKKEQ